ncbi:MAG: carboxypeptidase-like regulatory domain-containing protein, partial [Methanomassiliicoccales archaeon]|nr:carboxypeptidase-like regulatory domain-containing protein [Methanomassiliicoccales archaeon]
SLSIGSQLFSVSLGAQLQKQIAVYSAFSLSGRVTLDGLVVVNVTMILTSDQSRVFTMTDERGRYSVTLPEGDYTVYCLAVRDGKEYVAVVRVTGTTGVRNVDIALQAGMTVSGTVVENSDPVANSTVTLKSRASGAVVEVVTNSTGGFRVVVPSGSYFVYAMGTEKAFWGDILVSSSITITIVLSDSVTLSGRVWFDSDFDGTMDGGEGVANISVEVSDRDGRAVALSTDSEGDFAIVLPTGKSYSLSLAVDGYVSRTFNYTNLISSIAEDIELVPMNRTTTGVVLLGTTALAGIEIKFMADGDGSMTASTVTDASGLFSLSLRPGVYEVVIDQNVTTGSNSTRYQHSSSLIIAIGQNPSALTVSVTERVRVYGYVLPDRGSSAIVTFTGPEDRELSVSSFFDLYLVAGNYSVYVVYDSRSLRYAFLGEVSIDAGVSPLNVTTVEAYTTHGTLEYNDQTFISVVPVTITLQTGGTIVVNTTAVGSFEALLPTGTYDLSVDYRTTTRIDSKERYVRYTSNGTMTVPSTGSNALVLERHYDNSTVSGSIVRADGTPVSAVLEFISGGGTSMSLTVASGLGSYSASLAPGNYSLYVREIGGMGVYLAALEVAPNVDVTLNLTLAPGIRMMGSTLNGGVTGAASLEFSGAAQKTILSGPDGSYEIVLPAGVYQIQCSASGVENGISVEYGTTTNLILISDLSKTISLSKVETRGVDLQWDSREKMTLLPGETATYNVRIVNTGNVPEVFEMLEDTGAWSVSFSQDEIAVDFGTENSQLVTVTLTAPSNVKVVHSGQKITVVSSANSSVKDSVMLDATILPVYSVELDFKESLETSGANYTHTMELGNSGNVDDTYDITIANMDYLATLGWDAELRGISGGYGDSLTLSISSGKSEEFDLRLTPTRANPEPTVQVNVIAASQNSSDTYSIFDLEPVMPEISIPSNGVTVTGQDVFAGPGQVPIETIVLAGMCIASFAVLILLSLQRGLFRRRKR